MNTPWVKDASIANGTAEEINKAKDILKTTQPNNLDQHTLIGAQAA